MDPVTISAGVVALLAPYVGKAAEQFSGEAGKALWRKTEALLGRLRTRFAGDQPVKQALADFEQDPAAAGTRLRDLLVTRLPGDPTLSGEIVALLAEVKAAGPQVRVATRVKEAEDEVVGLEADRVARGDVGVTVDVDRARKKVTGAKLGSIE